MMIDPIPANHTERRWFTPKSLIRETQCVAVIVGRGYDVIDDEIGRHAPLGLAELQRRLS